MAFDAGTAWESRADGSMNYGGGFADLDPGTSVDYSQQTDPHLAKTDLAMTTGTTTLTSASGGFTASQVGNVIKIVSGANFVVGWYQITGYTDTYTVTIDRDATTGGLDGHTGVGNVGGALGVLNDAFLEQVAPGNTVYVESGTHTLTGSFSVANDGTTSMPIKIVGYREGQSRTGNPTGNDRPLLACGSYITSLGDYWHVENLRASVGAISGLYGNVGFTCRNCASENTSATADRYAVRGGTFAWFVGCWGKSANGYAFRGNYYAKAIGCVAEDSNVGFYFSGPYVVLAHCIADGCTTGVDIRSRPGCMIVNNTLYSGTTGIHGDSVADHSVILNNIISGYATGAAWGAQVGTNFWDYNDWHDNTADTDGYVTKGPHALALDPHFTDAANGDFSVGTNMKAAGFPGAFPADGAAVCTGYLDVGAVQREEAGGGGGGVRNPLHGMI